MLTFPNGKRYVGQTRRPVSVRIAGHRNAPKCRLVNKAFKKYGKNAVSVVEVASGVPVSLLNWLEGFCIALFGSYAPAGYNLSPIGCVPGTTSPEFRRAVSEGLRRRWEDPAQRAAASERGKAEVKAGTRDLSAMRRGAADPAVVARRKAAVLARDIPGVRAKRAASMAAAWQDPEKRAHMTESQRARWTPEYRAYFSKLLLAAHARIRQEAANA
jgi:hypothetical protein